MDFFNTSSEKPSFNQDSENSSNQIVQPVNVLRLKLKKIAAVTLLLAVFLALIWWLVSLQSSVVLDEFGRPIPRPRGESIRKIVDNCKTEECKIITQGNLAACNNLKDRQAIANCRTLIIKNQALYQLEPKLCSQLVAGQDQVACRSELFFRWALVNKNIGLCEHVENEILKQTCRQKFGVLPVGSSTTLKKG